MKLHRTLITFIAALAVISGLAAWAPHNAPATSSHTAPCENPLVMIPGAEPFHPGGASFTVLAADKDVRIFC